MNEYNDETLMAYCDGALGSSEAAQLRSRLAQDEKLNRRYLLLKELTLDLGGAYDSMLARPVPSRLVNTVMAGSKSTLNSRWNFRNGAIAAGFTVLAIGLGFTGGYISSGINQQQAIVLAQFENQQAMMALETKLNQVLETQKSGTSVSWKSDIDGIQAEITPLRTFKTKDNTYCREYRKVVTQNGLKRAEKNLSCRVDKGRWITRYRAGEGPRTRL